MTFVYLKLAGMTISFLIFLMFISSSADAAPTQTRRDRMKGETSEQRVSTDKMYERIYEVFLKDDYAAVDRMASDYLSGGTQRSNTEDVLYLQALSLLKLNRSQNAREKLRQLENSFIAADRKAQAAASIGDSYYFEGNLGMAHVAYAETLRKYPQSDQTPYMLSRLAEIASKTNRGQEAAAFKNRLLQEYPDSGEARDIVGLSITEDRAVPNGVYYTVQVGSFSRQKNAAALAQKLHVVHFDAYVEHDVPGQMYRVRVGKLISKGEAVSLEARLREQGYPTKIFP